ncbi:MAG: hypothetical protein GY932_14725 [Arcobacter sp.]|nr:hypothetical protein [Arcobacter sp.]
MKKAFTLLEVIISITIFMILLIVIYKVLDDTRVSNKKFEEYISKNEDINYLYKIFAEDIAESKDSITLDIDRDNNTIVIFESNNSFNDPFYSNITYMVSSNNNLVRVESLKKFEKGKSGIDFYNNSYIDILVKNIDKFIVLSENDKYVFIIKQEGHERIMFPTFKMEN